MNNTIMNKDKIKMNEVVNDGRSIYMYFDEKAGRYVAYGASAYYLTKLLDADVLLTDYSIEIQLPTVSITGKYLEILKKQFHVVSLHNGYVHLRQEKAFYEEDYSEWAEILRASIS